MRYIPIEHVKKMVVILVNLYTSWCSVEIVVGIGWICCRLAHITFLTIRTDICYAISAYWGRPFTDVSADPKEQRSWHCVMCLWAWGKRMEPCNACNAGPALISNSINQWLQHGMVICNIGADRYRPTLYWRPSRSKKKYQRTNFGVIRSDTVGLIHLKEVARLTPPSDPSFKCELPVLHIHKLLGQANLSERLIYMHDIHIKYRSSRSYYTYTATASDVNKADQARPRPRTWLATPQDRNLWSQTGLSSQKLSQDQNPRSDV